MMLQEQEMRALVSLLACKDYFKPCGRCQQDASDASTARDLQSNFFATSPDCWCLACSRCRGELENAGYHTLQIRRSSHQDVVKIHDIRDLCPAAVLGVQAYTINGHKVAFLRTRPVPREAKAGPMCISCYRGIQEGNSYCSLECKVVTDWKCLNDPPVDSEPVQKTPVSSPTKSSSSSADIFKSPMLTNTSQQLSSPKTPSLGQTLLTGPNEGFQSKLQFQARKRRKMMHPMRSAA